VSAPLDELYLRWLYGRVSKRRPQPPRTWWKLFRYLYTTEFVWFVPNDDNRVEDGRELRDEFLQGRELDLDEREWMKLGCSVLEMLVALSRRLAFEGGGEPAGWFWILLHNLMLDFHDDERFDLIQPEILDNIVFNLIWRRYRSDGSGGLFPLKDARQDQRKVEIWYQMQAWLLENE
jgi:hypothetical protein